MRSPENRGQVPQQYSILINNLSKPAPLLKAIAILKPYRKRIKTCKIEDFPP